MPEVEIVHEQTSEIVCPWCGHQIPGSWERFALALTMPGRALSTPMRCGKCDKPFMARRIVTETYSTGKIES